MIIKETVFTCAVLLFATNILAAPCHAQAHGDTVVGRSVREATIRTIYTHIDAQAQNAALALSPKITSLNELELEINSTENFDADRPWQNYLQRLPEKR